MIVVIVHGAHLRYWSSKELELVGWKAIIYSNRGELMYILACGDVSGQPGRFALKRFLPDLVKKYNVDVCVVNVDNAAHGLGITPDIYREIRGYGADVCTGGNHVFDKLDIVEIAKKDSRFLRPYNYSEYTPGGGLVKFRKNDKDILVVHMAGQKEMKESADNPFVAMDKILDKYVLGKNIDAIIVDFHAELTSEKVAFGHYLDGRVSFVFGTHTHVPTADLRVLNNGTAYITDIGMTADYDTVISMDKSCAISSFLRVGNFSRLRPTSGEGTLFAVLVKLNDKGLAQTTKLIRLGQEDLWK